MEKNVKKLAEIVDEIATEYDWDEEFALHLVSLVAGGDNMIPDWLEEHVNDCDDEDDECDLDDVPAADDKYKDEDDEDDWDEEDVEDNTVMNEFRTVGQGNRIIVPNQMVEEAEKIVGRLDSKKNGYGAITITRYDAHTEGRDGGWVPEQILIEFGDKVKSHKNDFLVLSSKIIHLNANGQLQFRANPFEEGDDIQMTLQKDGSILIEEA